MKQHNHIFTIPTCIILAIFITRPVDGYDVWWNLNSGLWMLEQHQILLKDYWSFTKYGSEWINASWLFHVLMAIFFKTGGAWGLLLLKYLFTFFGLLLVANASIKRHHQIYFIIAFFILFPFIYGHLHIRPLIYSFTAIGYIIWASQRPFDRRLAIISFFVLVIWANSHGSAIAGATALAIQATFSQWPGEKDKKVPLLFAALFLIAPFLSPLWTSILNLLLIHEGSISTSLYIGEWAAHVIFPAQIWLPFLIVSAAYILQRLRLSYAELFLILFFLYFSIRSQRFEMELALLLIRPFSAAIGQIIENIRDVNKFRIAGSAILLLLAHLFVYHGQIGSLAIFKERSWPLNISEYPKLTSDIAKSIATQIGRPLRAINEYNFGGYIPFRTEGTVQILIDGRTPTLFPEQLLVLPYETDHRLLDRLADQYDADAVFLKLGNTGTLFGLKHWTLVAFDATSALFIRPELAQQIDLPHIEYNPVTYSNVRDEFLEAKILATEELLKHDLSNSLALNHLAMFKSALAKTRPEWSEVYELLRRSDQLNPQDGFARATLALLLAREAATDPTSLRHFIEALPRPDALTPGISTNNDLTYAATLIDAGLTELAADYLYPANSERRRALDTLAETWRLRLLVDLKRGKLKNAGQSLEMARLLYPADHPHQQQLNELEKLLRPQSGVGKG